jgi:hypothetical protein
MIWIMNEIHWKVSWENVAGWGLYWWIQLFRSHSVVHEWFHICTMMWNYLNQWAMLSSPPHKYHHSQEMGHQQRLPCSYRMLDWASFWGILHGALFVPDRGYGPNPRAPPISCLPSSNFHGGWQDESTHLQIFQLHCRLTKWCNELPAFLRMEESVAYQREDLIRQRNVHFSRYLNVTIILTPPSLAVLMRLGAEADPLHKSDNYF